MISAALIGDRSLVQRYRALPANLKREVDRETDRLCFRLQAEVQRDFLTGQVLKVRTGRLRASITRGAPDTRTHVEFTATASYGFVGTNVKYGAIWELSGIAAHDIVPRNAKALRFNVGGQTLFRKRVHIPAQGPRPFLAPALQRMKPEIITSYRATFHRVAQQTLRG